MLERYQVQITTCARHQLNQMPDDLRTLVLRSLAQAVELASSVAPPSPEMLQEAGIEPPVLRLRAGPLIIVCEADPEQRALRVLHVACVTPRSALRDRLSCATAPALGWIAHCPAG